MTPKDILQLESTDIRQAYLFEENGHWYAYEHSANRIEKFVKGFVDFKDGIRDLIVTGVQTCALPICLR